MADIIDFNQIKTAKDALEGGWQFMICQECDADPEQPVRGFAPLVCFDRNGPIIGGMVCLGCQEIAKVVNGRVTE